VASPAPISASGDFCVDLPLGTYSLNKISVRVADTNGTLSDAIERDITQNGMPPAQQDPRPSYDAAAGSGITIPAFLGIPLYDFEDGTAANMIDDDPSSQVTLSYNPIRTSGYIWLGLATEREPVNTIHISSDPSCPLRAFDLFVAEADVPGAPSDSNGNWTRVSVTTFSSGTGEDEVAFPTRPVSQVALVPTIESCGSWLTSYQHKIKEIRAMTEAFVPPPDAVAPQCGH
jgi:hypothetical protein